MSYSSMVLEMSYGRKALNSSLSVCQSTQKMKL
uniref:Uncharacterized protein n=1 Tax=Rhizophora mucronata TaxID=61149 RepID=A0A2P2R0C2_RHIMU